MVVFAFNDSYKIQRYFWMRIFVLNFMKVNSNLLIIFVLRIISIVPPTKLREGNVFTHVCLFTGRMQCDYGPVERSSLEDPPLALLPTWDLFKLVHFGPPSPHFQTCSNLFTSQSGWLPSTERLLV